jgi:glycosyltransferase involved in cell wall biosynthesis
VKVSCVMPTCNRREFIPSAIKCFESQTWEDKELIVLDDGESVQDLIPSWAKYHRCEKLKIGAKRNRCCELASGEVIIHWDDDDWSAPERIETQVKLLVESGRQVTGYRNLLFWDGEKAFKYKGATYYACGTTLCYYRSFWESNQFSNALGIGEDGLFVWQAAKQGKLHTSNDVGLIVARIHDRPTSKKATGTSNFPPVDVSELPKQFPKWSVTP